jgi:DNA-binding NtrC family response regulator
MSPTATESYISDVRRIRQSLRTGEILIIEDDFAIGNLVESLCKSLGKDTKWCKSYETAHAYLTHNFHSVKMAVIDYSLQGMPADGLIDLCCEHNVPCIIHTGRVDKIGELSRKYPDIIVVLKPCPIERLLKELV